MIHPLAAPRGPGGTVPKQPPQRPDQAGQPVAEHQVRVTVSEIGRTLSILAAGTSKGGAITLASFAEQLEADRDAVTKKLQGLYHRLGIDAAAAIDFSIDQDGTIQVEGNDSKIQPLAEAINADTDLANTIRRMAGTAALLEAARRHQEFTREYAQNPQQALARFGYLLEDAHNYHVDFSSNNSELQISTTSL